MADRTNFNTICRESASVSRVRALQGCVRVLKAAFRAVVDAIDQVVVQPDVEAALREQLTGFARAHRRSMNHLDAAALLAANPLELTRLVNLADVGAVRVVPTTRGLLPVLDGPAAMTIHPPPSPAPRGIDAPLQSGAVRKPPARADRPAPRIQPRKAGERALPLQDPTSVIRPAPAQPSRWAGNPYAGFTVPVVLANGAHFQFQRIVSVVVFYHDEDGRDTYVELEGAPSLVPFDSVPTLALHGAPLRVVEAPTEPVVEVGGSSHFQVDGVLESEHRRSTVCPGAVDKDGRTDGERETLSAWLTLNFPNGRY